MRLLDKWRTWRRHRRLERELKEAQYEAELVLKIASLGSESAGVSDGKCNHCSKPLTEPAGCFHCEDRHDKA